MSVVSSPVECFASTCPIATIPFCVQCILDGHIMISYASSTYFFLFSFFILSLFFFLNLNSGIAVSPFINFSLFKFENLALASINVTGLIKPLKCMYAPESWIANELHYVIININSSPSLFVVDSSEACGCRWNHQPRGFLHLPNRLGQQ